MAIRDDVIQAFEKIYGEQPAFVVRAPGRVNLIGEHTDYNDGFVLPMAIDRAVWIALRPKNDGQVEVHTLDYHQKHQFSLKELDLGKKAHGGETPVEYIKGVAWSLQDDGYKLNGWEGVLTGDVPRGAGLSSSAALELATARAFAAVSGFDWESSKMALLSQKAENQWVGVRCGIMDQMISASGQNGCALLIDCRSLETQLAPLPQGTAVVVLDSGTRRGLVTSAYNERREQCETAAKFFGVPALRDVTMEQFNAKASGLDDVTMRRARHVISENDRTQKAAEVMANGDAVALGKLMNESHVSMRDDFEISTAALNAIVECAQGHPACYGARLTGAGFGGAAVALVEAVHAQDFAGYVSGCYTQATGNTPQVYICKASSGAEVVLAQA